MTLADLIKRHLTEASMSQAAFARAAHLSPSFVTHLLNGTRLPRKPEHITNLARALDCTTDEVYASIHKLPPGVIEWLTSSPDHISQVRRLMGEETP